MVRFFLSAPGSLRDAVHAAMRLHRGRTPIELGFGRMVDFDKGHFNGRRALVKQHETGQRYALVRLDIGGYKPAQDALIYHRKRREVGHVTSGVWSPTTKRNIALAELKAPYGLSQTADLWAEIYVNEEGRWAGEVFRDNPTQPELTQKALDSVAALPPPTGLSPEAVEALRNEGLIEAWLFQTDGRYALKTLAKAQR